MMLAPHPLPVDPLTGRSAPLASLSTSVRSVGERAYTAPIGAEIAGEGQPGAVVGGL
jgi:hypothetical protein